jgi:hypothetical protein
MRLLLSLLLVVSSHVFADLAGHYSSLRPLLAHNFDADNRYTGRFEAQTVEGIWEQGANVCEPFNEARIKIYAGSGQCCLAVKQLGDRYIFSKILFSGDYKTKLYGLCSHAVLKRRVD